MSIGSAESKRANGPSPFLVVSDRPFLQLRIDIKWTRFEVDRWIALMKMQARRDLPLFQREHELYNARYAGSSAGMTEIRFDRSHCTELLLIREFAKCPSDG